MKRQRIAEQWSEFAKKLQLHTAPITQQREMRRAFYAGAWAFYSIQMNAISQGNDISPEDMQLMSDLDREMVEFNEAMKAGRA